MSSFPFKVGAGTDVNTNVGFNPISVIVSNYSPYYIYFPDGLSFCPPWTAGVILPLAHSTQAKAVWSLSPFGKQVVPPTPTGIVYSATFLFADENLGISGGTSVVNPFQVTDFQLYINSFHFTPSAITGSTFPIIGAPLPGTNIIRVFSVNVERDVGQYGDTSEGSSPISWLLKSSVSSQLVAAGRVGYDYSTPMLVFPGGRDVAIGEGLVLDARSSYARDSFTMVLSQSFV